MVASVCVQSTRMLIALACRNIRMKVPDTRFDKHAHTRTARRDIPHKLNIWIAPKINVTSIFDARANACRQWPQKLACTSYVDQMAEKVSTDAVKNEHQRKEKNKQPNENL